MTAVPKYEAHLKSMIMMLTMQIGVDKSHLAPLLSENPSFLLSQAPCLPHNLRELRRALAFHFDIFLKTSADELPETWKMMLRQRPELVLLDPQKAEAMLRWWATLVKTAGMDSDTATAFVKNILITSPGILNKKVKSIQHEANQVWWHAKERRQGSAGSSGGNCGATCSSTTAVTKRMLIGEPARARFTLAYIARNANIVNNEELHSLQSLQTEVEECLTDLGLYKKGGDEKSNTAAGGGGAQGNIKVR
jgi:hypothetical protein